ncbi:flagellar basal body rod protein FlgC [Pacificimonas pallii]
MSIFDVSGKAMSAQMVRLNATASNLANAGTVAGSAETAYRSRRPIFAAALDQASSARATVEVERVVTTDLEPTRRLEPGHPLADKDGYVWEAAVDSNAELVDMMEAARQYQNNVEVLRTAKGLMMSTLRLGQ